MRLNLGFEYLFNDSDKIDFKIFQPQFRMQGKNKLSSMSKEINISQIEKIIALDKTKDENFMYL